MRAGGIFSLLWAVAAVAADRRTAQVYIEAIDSASAPALLADVSYDLAALSESSILSYETPDLPETARLVRIGLYDAKSQTWMAGTTAAAADNFGKAFSPNLVLSVDARGEVVSVACRGVGIDAGQTRNFGPKVVVLPELPGPSPQLNKPVVLSPEGKKVEAEPEKTLLQKYWWVLALVVFITMSGGGGAGQVEK